MNNIPCTLIDYLQLHKINDNRAHALGTQTDTSTCSHITKPVIKYSLNSTLHYFIHPLHVICIHNLEYIIIKFCHLWFYITNFHTQGGSNMTGTCAAYTNQSWSYLNHLVFTGWDQNRPRCRQQMFVCHCETAAYYTSGTTAARNCFNVTALSSWQAVGWFTLTLTSHDLTYMFRIIRERNRQRERWTNLWKVLRAI
jgi:hypothetical protein